MAALSDSLMKSKVLVGPEVSMTIKNMEGSGQQGLDRCGLQCQVSKLLDAWVEAVADIDGRHPDIKAASGDNIESHMHGNFSNSTEYSVADIQPIGRPAIRSSVQSFLLWSSPWRVDIADVVTCGTSRQALPTYKVQGAYGLFRFHFDYGEQPGLAPVEFGTNRLTS
ncbi:uncharacterized protein CIMG_05011 [Coccidioides immitis RS]|uniref:Uncharacterized protein n=1 Tax=Coccidioides immitis (strain RS) TaxID=246410 RepID=J3KEQ4_COCIM|nr:uncharacterized protein CIMG_05011 [Coccidioides immitis RS]EAS33987.3 hypothetical protein CIMG_05011 [Coccidioides immitis RS]